MKKFHTSFSLLLVGIIVLPFPSVGQNTMFEKLSAIENLDITIEANWDTLYSFRDDSEVKAKIEINGESMKADLELRGKSRRSKCLYKPFWLKFKKKELRAAGLEEFDKFKVVTQCLDDDEAPENMNEEFLIYELYNIITDQSFRVKRFTLTMVWPDNVRDPITSTCFLIEPTAEVGYRLEGKEVEQYGMPEDSIEATSYVNTAMFQFMIGNYDWDPAVMQNIKYFKTDKSIVVPYDFDYSAIVRPPYQRIPRSLGLKESRDRIYLGQYFSDQIGAARERFVGKEEEILEHVNTYPHLKKSRNKRIAAYLKRYFKLAKDESEEIDTGYILFYSGG